MYGWRSTGRRALFFSCLSIVCFFILLGSSSEGVMRYGERERAESPRDGRLEETPLAHAPRTAQQSIPKLKVDRTVERELAGEATHSYRIKLRVGEFLRVEVEQRSTDVNVSLVDPDEKQGVEVNSRKDKRGTEKILAIAEVKGYYRLDVRAAEKAAKPGSYAVRIGALRKATDTDRNLVSADTIMREADRLRAESKPDTERQAIEKYKSALSLWHTLGERRREADALGRLGGLSRTLGEYKETLDYCNRALGLSRELGDRKSEASALGNIGQTYEAMGQYKQALDFYRQALPILLETGNLRD